MFLEKKYFRSNLRKGENNNNKKKTRRNIKIIFIIKNFAVYITKKSIKERKK